MVTNTLRKDESFKVGQQSESDFEKAANKENYIVSKATREENMFKHIDFFLGQDHFKFGVDVKARKKTNRSDSSFNDDWTWIEFKNVRGNPGWLYGEADFIGFEREDDFLLVNRQKLIEYCDEKVDLETIVDKAYNAEYKGYQRKGRKDLITRIRMDDLNYLEGNIIISK